MTMTPTEAIAYLHGTTPANPDDIHLTKQYEACAALAPLVGRTDLDGRPSASVDQRDHDRHAT
jgi:hypothetical protein